MSVSSYDDVAEKVLSDIELALKKHPQIHEFYIIPTAEEENKNSSPIIKAENTLGLESWIVSHIYPYAHYQIMQKDNYKSQNLGKVIPCLTGVTLLNPEMPNVWNRRRELILSKKLHIDNELRLTKMALSRKPKCNDALTHRRWIITQILKDIQDKSSLLAEELHLTEMIANRYHSNYHAWSHRIWSMQHLLPDLPFYSSKRKAQKNCFFENISIELSEIMNRSITNSEFSFIKNCEISQIFFEEFENNFKWISSHVSDHSGLNFRKFLITEILTFIKNYLNFSNKMEVQNELDFMCANSECNLVSNVFSICKLNLIEFLGSFNFVSNYKKAVDKYLINLEQELTLFDIGMFLILAELKSNNSLCVLFLNHEALWYYRRFLIYMYKQLIDAFDFSKNNKEHRLFLHLDSNGVPYKKDFKFGNLENSDLISKHSDFYMALYMRLINNEEEIISKITSQDDHIKSLLKNYNLWLKHFFKTEKTCM